MKCPNCGAASGDGAAECPACGLVFAKWRERQEKEKLEAAEALRLLETGPKAAPVNPWVGRGIAAMVVLIWLAAVGLYLSRRAQRAKPSIGEDTGNFVMMRDPKTGEMRRLPIRRLNVPGAAPTR